MSAWLCSDAFIAQIVAAGCVGSYAVDAIGYAAGFDIETIREGCLYPDEFAPAIANILRAENYRSLVARYGADDPFWSPIESEASPFKISLGELDQAARIPLGYAVKMLDCYEYQACEASDWRETRAFRICEAIRRNLSRRFPGYDESGAWGDPFPFPHPAPNLVSLTALANRPRKSKS